MKSSAIICEYNPFHNGHKHHLNCVKNDSDNAVVAIMSGNFTQRGDIAIFDKFTRAETALKNGADLVVELPAVYAVSSGESFSKAGVQLADAIGCERLCFSAEEKDTSLLFKAADAFNDKEFNTLVKANMNNGMYYPPAVEKAMAQLYGKQTASVLQKPNNTLGIEYLKALKGTDIKPFITERIGADHDSNRTVNNIASASNIRQMLLSGEDVSGLVPTEYSDECADIKALEKAILYKLRTMSVEDIKALPDVNEGLENRIFNSIRSCCTVEEIILSIKTKRYTMARIRRIIICALLGITEDLVKEPVPYIRVLGFSDKGKELLKDIKHNSNLPLITNVAQGYRELNGIGKEVFNIDLRASDIYTLGCKKIKPCGQDFKQFVIRAYLKTEK